MAVVVMVVVVVVMVVAVNKLLDSSISGNSPRSKIQIKDKHVKRFLLMPSIKVNRTNITLFWFFINIGGSLIIATIVSWFDWNSLYGVGSHSLNEFMSMLMFIPLASVGCISEAPYTLKLIFLPT